MKVYSPRLLNRRVRNLSLSQVGNSANTGPSSRVVNEDENNKKSRSGHKSYSTNALNKVDECLADYTAERTDELVQWKESLQEHLQKVTTLSDQILALMEADEELTDEDLSTELMDTNTLKIDVKLRL